MSSPYTLSLGPSYAQPSLASRVGGFFKRSIYLIFGLAILSIIGYFLYTKYAGSSGTGMSTPWSTPTDQTPVAVDGTKGTTIKAVDIPMGDTTDYGVQYWMYIKDWSYGFGRGKGVLLRADPTNPAIVNPRITLHPTDNSLNVTVSLYPAGTRTGAANPSPANATNTTGDKFTCTVENVPLQAWFSVSVTVFQRNIDIYINGRLVKSCVLPGIPKLATGDIVIGANRGFSGSICNVHHYPRMLTPGDALTFYSAGTTCGAVGVPTASADTGSSFSLFGYTFRFSVKDKKGEEVRNYSF